MSGAAEQVWTFDAFEVGATLGTAEVALDDHRRALWERIYGPSDAAVPQGLLVAAMMEGYIAAIQPRPKGNVHVGQTCAFTDRAVRPGARLTVEIVCKGKEMKRGRRWLTLAVQVRDGDAPVLTGEIVSIWAA